MLSVALLATYPPCLCDEVLIELTRAVDLELITASEAREIFLDCGANSTPAG